MPGLRDTSRWVPWICLLLMVAAASPAQGKILEGLDVKLGHSRLVDLPVPVKRLSVGKAEVADVLMVTPRQLYVNAVGVGSTNISLWAEDDSLLGVFEVRVARDLNVLKERFHQILPQEPVEVRELQGAVVLSGQVSSLEAKQRAEDLAKAFAPEQVTSLLQVGGSQQVMLKVAFAEVSRRVTKRFNINISSFNPFTGDFLFTMLGNLFNPYEITAGAVDNGWSEDPDYNKHHSFGFKFDPSRNLGAMGGFKVGDQRILGFLDILKENGLAKILAEPTLVATSGQKASFLAGGEFPIPVPQDNKISIEFKKFGVQLAFTPEVRADGSIKLTVAPEVSELDFTTAVVIEGFSVPGLTTRQASTQLEVKDGQPFAIAGLFRDDLVQNVGKIPMLGDIPILGALFRSSDFQSNKTELVIVVTPQIVKAGMGQPAGLPTDDLREPDDVGFYLLGQMASTKAPLGPPVGWDELEGNFGHDPAF